MSLLNGVDVCPAAASHNDATPVFTHIHGSIIPNSSHLCRGLGSWYVAFNGK